MKAVKSSLVCLLALFFLGCANMGVSQKHLSAEDFLWHYDNPGTPGDYWEYKGLNKGRFWIYHYGFKQPQLSVISVLEKGFVMADEMPKGFPTSPQPKLKSADTNAIKTGLEGWLKETNAGP